MIDQNRILERQKVSLKSENLSFEATTSLRVTQKPRNCRSVTYILFYKIFCLETRVDQDLVNRSLN